MILIVDNKSNFIKDYERVLIKKKINFLVMPFFNVEEFDKIKGDVTHVILSGGVGSPGKPLKLELDFRVLDELDVPIMGVCLGAEAIVQHYGGKIGRLKRRQEKMETIRIVKRDKIFRGLKDEFILQESHSHYISLLPKNFEVLASSSVCEFEVTKHISKDLYAFQGHPEHTRGGGEKIMKNFLSL